MIRWRRFRVHFEEVVQDMKEGQDMVSIATELCFPNIIDNHVADFFGSMLSGEKVARQRRCRHFRYVLVLGDGEHLLLGQATKLDTIFHRDHGIKRFLFSGKVGYQAWWSSYLKERRSFAR